MLFHPFADRVAALLGLDVAAQLDDPVTPGQIDALLREVLGEFALRRRLGVLVVMDCTHGVPFTRCRVCPTADQGKLPDMPQEAWSAKRERQYEHIKEGLEDRGRSEDVAEEIAARTVNKERARHGEAKVSSKLSKTDISSGRRGGLRSHKGPGGRTRDQLYQEAKERNIKGRSKMTKSELERAVG